MTTILVGLKIASKSYMPKVETFIYQKIAKTGNFLAVQ